MAPHVITGCSTDDGNIRLGLTGGGRDSRLTTTEESFGKSRRENIGHGHRDYGIVSRVFRHFGYNPSFKQFDIVVLAQNAGLDHLMILVNRKPADRDGWQDCGRR